MFMSPFIGGIWVVWPANYWIVTSYSDTVNSVYVCDMSFDWYVTWLYTFLMSLLYIFLMIIIIAGDITQY